MINNCVNKNKVKIYYKNEIYQFHTRTRKIAYPIFKVYWKNKFEAISIYRSLLIIYTVKLADEKLLQKTVLSVFDNI